MSPVIRLTGIVGNGEALDEAPRTVIRGQKCKDHDRIGSPLSLMPGLLNIG